MSNGTIIITVTTDNCGSQVQTLARRRFNAALIVLTWSSSSLSSALLPSLPESATTETTSDYGMCLRKTSTPDIKEVAVW